MSREDYVDIIVPVFNGELFIAEALESILNQTYNNFRIIIVNDGSYDNTLAIINDYEKRNPDKIKIINHEINLGLSRARNNGIKQSTSKYVAFHDCDDISEKTKYEEIINYLKTNNLDGCGCFGKYFRNQLSNTCGCPQIKNSYNEIFIDLHNVNHFIVSSMVLKKEALDKINGFDVILKGCQDYDLWCRLMMNGYKLENLPKCLHNIRLHNSSLSVTITTDMKKEEKFIRNKYERFLTKWERDKKFYSFQYESYIKDKQNKIRRNFKTIKKELNSGMNIGLIIIATNKYIEFFNPLYNSIKSFFLKGHNIKTFLFTNNFNNLSYPNTNNVTIIPIQHKPWPYMTLLRYKIIWDNKEYFKDLDYIFYCDVDMRFVDTIGDEILSKLTATIHPGYFNKTPKMFPFEKNHNSEAFIKDKNNINNYFAGGFQGGEKDVYLNACKILSDRIDADLKKNIIAVWHDETHWNKYLSETLPSKILTPSYCYPETGYEHLKMTKKIIALNKNHKEFRK